MRLDKIARNTRLKTLSEEEDICNLLFDYEKTRQACRIFISWIKSKNGKAKPSEVSQFGRDLQAGKIVEGFRYSRKNFYRTILRRLVDLGFLSLDEWFTKKRPTPIYTWTYQPIPKRSPGGRNFWHLAWQLCEKWNQQFR